MLLASLQLEFPTGCHTGSVGGAPAHNLVLFVEDTPHLACGGRLILADAATMGTCTSSAMRYAIAATHPPALWVSGRVLPCGPSQVIALCTDTALAEAVCCASLKLQEGYFV